MKIDIYVPTGEIRKAKQGEWLYDGTKWTQWAFPGESSESYPIGIHHQIEVPDSLKVESIKIIGMNASCELGQTSIELDEIDLPRPKKVKKWQWLYQTPVGKLWLLTCGHYATEEKMRNTVIINPNMPCFKFEKSMIEVEE